MEVTQRFAEVWPRTPKRDQAMLDLFVQRMPWQVVVAALYLGTGRFMPREAKEHGVSFGFCDSDGNYVRDIERATHVGWTVEPEVTHADPTR